jgi:GT2 family glycosyltransferase
MDEPDKVMTDGCDFNHPNGVGFFQRREIPLTKRIAEVDIVNGCATMISAQVFQKIGFIDERFFLVHEESDFCLRARNAGFRCGVLGAALVWHKGSSSFARSGKKLQRYYDARNLFLLLSKHRRHPGGRGRIASLGAYFRYVYHRYCHEREQGSNESAQAVVAGLCDALGQQYGRMRKRKRLGARFLGGLMETVRRCRG